MKGTSSLSLFYLLLLLLCLHESSSGKKTNVEEKCETCRHLVKKFHEGMEKTAKNHFGGGDTAWEETRLGKYARSETRLLEILENVCDGASKKDRCHAMVEEQEEEIESFWFKKQSQIEELEKHLCNDVIKVCCDTGKYGDKCSPCAGGVTNPCFGRGKCGGSGTRGGDGKCACDAQYQGAECEECADGYYDAYGNTTCKKCHETCENTCTDGTNKGCDKCQEGYVDAVDEGCVDIDECEKEDICEHGKFCINKKGTHKCEDCDPACNGCNGTGRLRCKECNKGWTTLESQQGCVDVNECEGEHNCDVGTYCSNHQGSYTCDACNVACSGGCTDGTPNTCVECAPGYKMSNNWVETNGCVDVNQCEEENMTCAHGEVCVNKPGLDACEACDDTCQSCVSPEPSGCLVCKEGYSLAADGKGCADVDECTATPSNPCTLDGEICKNKEGGYKCLCDKGWMRTKDGICKKKQEKKKKEPEPEPKEDPEADPEDDDDNDDEKDEL